MIVLGQMILDPGAAVTAQGILRSDDFAADRHRLIYAAMLRGLNECGQIDTLTLGDELDRNGELRRVGGLLYLATLLDGVITAVNSEQNAQRVLEHSQRRRIAHSAREVLFLHRDGKKLCDLVAASQKGLLGVGERRASGRHENLTDIVTRSLDALDERIADPKSVTGIPTGLDQLDSLTLGWHPTELSVVAARSGHGKSAYMLHATLAAARAGYRVAIQSLEMSSMSLADRLLTATAQVPGQDVRSGNLSPFDRGRIVEAAAELHKHPITVDESTGQTIHDIVAKTRNLKAKHSDLALLFVDYVQFIKPTGTMESYRLEQGLASAALKDLARELEIAVVGLCQVSRPQQGTEYRRPFISHLKESGSWEHDSDVVLILHCPDISDRARARKEDRTGVCEFWLDKQRHGPTGNFEAEFHKSKQSFSSYLTKVADQ